MIISQCQAVEKSAALGRSATRAASGALPIELAFVGRASPFFVAF